jgi:hypothetical protein
MEIKQTTKSSEGTALRGYISISYEKLVDLLGKPNSEGDEYKVDVEWVLEVGDKIVKIYNWKNGKGYWGNSGLRPEQITEWHIGANKNSKKEVQYLIKKLTGKFKPLF